MAAGADDRGVSACTSNGLGLELGKWLPEGALDGVFLSNKAVVESCNPTTVRAIAVGVAVGGNNNASSDSTAVSAMGSLVDEPAAATAGASTGRVVGLVVGALVGCPSSLGVDCGAINSGSCSTAVGLLVGRGDGCTVGTFVGLSF